MFADHVTSQKNINTYGFNGALGNNYKLEREKKLTQLHVFVIRGDTIMVDSCVRHNTFDVNSLDARGWTPLHHAALHKDPTIYDKLKKAGANENLRNDCGATPADLRRFTQGVKKTYEAGSFIGLMSENRIPLTFFSYQSLTQSTYINDHYVSRRTLIQEWLGEPVESLPIPFLEEFTRKYIDFCNNPLPTHILKPCSYNDLEEPLENINGLGLFADRNYASGEVIGEYIGKVIIDSFVSDFSIQSDSGCLDGQKYSNGITRISDGFPNVMSIPLANCRGRPARSVFVTTSSIKQGDQFCISTGNLNGKLGPYQELRPKALRIFLQETKNLVRIYDLASLDSPEELHIYSFDQICEYGKLHYLLTTPSVFFELTIEGGLDEEVAHKLWKRAFQMIENVPMDTQRSLQKLADTAIQCQQYCKKEPSMGKIFKNELHHIIANKGIVKALIFAELHLTTAKTLNVFKIATIGLVAIFGKIKSVEIAKVEKKEGRAKIQVMMDKKFLNYKAIYNIGHQLTPSDIGKLLVRTAPAHLERLLNCPFGDLDWSYVGKCYDLNYTKRSALTLLKITDTNFVVENEGRERSIQRRDYFDDDNWITFEDYSQFITTHSLDDFEQIDSPPKNINRVVENEPKKRPESLTEKLIFQAWVKAALKRVTKFPGNHTYQFTSNQTTGSQSETEVPEVKSARQELGVDQSASFEEVRKRYKTLAVKCHPDKNGGNDEKFKKILQAYECLCKVYMKEQFDPSKYVTLEGLLKRAREVFDSLEQRLVHADHKLCFEEWKVLYSQLSNVKITCNDRLINWNFETLVKQCHERMFYSGIQLKLLEESKKFQGLLAKLSHAQAIKELPGLIASLHSLYTEFDLANKNSTWAIIGCPHFKNANLLMMDRIFAYERTLAEAYLKEGENNKAFEVRKQALDNFEHMRDIMYRRIFEAEKAWNEKESELNPPREEAFTNRSEKASSSQKNNSSEKPKSNLVETNNPLQMKLWKEFDVVNLISELKSNYQSIELRDELSNNDIPPNNKSGVSNNESTPFRAFNQDILMLNILGNLEFFNRI